jgi:hypothetical protein
MCEYAVRIPESGALCDLAPWHFKPTDNPLNLEASILPLTGFLKDSESSSPIKPTLSMLNLEAVVGSSLALEIDKLDLNQVNENLVEKDSGNKEGMNGLGESSQQSDIQKYDMWPPNDFKIPESILFPPELLKVITLEETRSLVLVNASSISLNILISHIKIFGTVSYIIPDFHTSRGVVFFAYHDIRSSITAFNEMLPALSTDLEYTQLHFCPMLNLDGFYDGRLLLHNVPTYIPDSDVLRVLSKYGDVQAFSRKTFGNGSDRFVAEFYDILSTKSALSGMKTSIPFGSSTTVYQMSCHEKFAQKLMNLIETLKTWRSYASVDSGNQYVLKLRQGEEKHTSSLDLASKNLNPRHDLNGASASPPCENYGAYSHGNQFNPVYFGAPALYLNSACPTGSFPHGSCTFVLAPNSFFASGQFQKLNSYGKNELSKELYSPDSDFTLDFEKVIKGLDSRTTLMVRNIPNKYTQQMLLSEINAEFEGKYDFFYLPIDFKNHCNVGYAFINFISHLSVPAFYCKFNGKKWKTFNSEKVCAVSFARIQGKASMISRFQNSSLMEKEEQYRPLLFFSDGKNMGKEEPFPTGNKVRREINPM